MTTKKTTSKKTSTVKKTAAKQEKAAPKAKAPQPKAKKAAPRKTTAPASKPGTTLTRTFMCARRCRRGPGLYLSHWVSCKRERLGCKKKALVAGARKLAEAIWRPFTLGECFSFRKPFGPLPAELLAKAEA